MLLKLNPLSQEISTDKQVQIKNKPKSNPKPAVIQAIIIRMVDTNTTTATIIVIIKTNDLIYVHFDFSFYMKSLLNLIFTLFSLYPIFDIRYKQLLYSISCYVNFNGFY